MIIMKGNPDSVSVILSQQKQPVSAMFSDSLLHCAIGVILMTSTAWVLQWFCGEFSPPAARPTGHQPQCMETNIQSEFSFERFLEVQLIFGGRLTI